jgi:hypothetical protein
MKNIKFKDLVPIDNLIIGLLKNLLKKTSTPEEEGFVENNYIFTKYYIVYLNISGFNQIDIMTDIMELVDKTPRYYLDKYNSKSIFLTPQLIEADNRLTFLIHRDVLDVLKKEL